MKRILRKRRKEDVLKAVAAGALLGLGAPAGYLLSSFFFLNPDRLGLFSWCFEVLNEDPLLLTYLTFPTVIVFSLFGLYHGVQESRLARKNFQMEHFLAVASHDIRSPLAAVQQAADLLQEGAQGSLSPGQKALAGMIKRQSGLIGDLVQELLDLHQMEAGEYELLLEWTEIIPLIEKAAEEMRILAAQKSGELKIVTDLPRETRILADSFKLRQVIRNLIDNAIKHLREGGKILIYVMENAAKELEIAVHNEGECIKEEKLPLVFNKFVQAEDRDKSLGYGLGLSICKDIVELHHGRIWAENVRPQGVCFHVSLPKIQRREENDNVKGCTVSGRKKGTFWNDRSPLKLHRS